MGRRPVARSAESGGPSSRRCSRPMLGNLSRMWSPWQPIPVPVAFAAHPVGLVARCALAGNGSRSHHPDDLSRSRQPQPWAGAGLLRSAESGGPSSRAPRAAPPATCRGCGRHGRHFLFRVPSRSAESRGPSCALLEQPHRQPAEDVVAVAATSSAGCLRGALCWSRGAVRPRRRWLTVPPPGRSQPFPSTTTHGPAPGCGDLRSLVAPRRSLIRTPAGNPPRMWSPRPPLPVSGCLRGAPC
jgi:hypothetical protein